MTSGPLSGRTIVITRAASQARRLNVMLSNLGAHVLPMPLIEVAPPADAGVALRTCVDQLSSYDWVACTSANAARSVLAALQDRQWPDSVRVAAVGQASAKVLLDAGVAVSVVPAKSTAKALAQSLSLELGHDSTARVFAPLAELASADLVDGLRNAGINVDTCEAYRTIVPEHPSELFEQAARADAILLSSPSTVDRLVDRLPQPGDGQKGPALICIGPATAAQARARGVKVAAIANPHSEAGLVGVTVDHFA